MQMYLAGPARTRSFAWSMILKRRRRAGEPHASVKLAGSAGSERSYRHLKTLECAWLSNEATPDLIDVGLGNRIGPDCECEAVRQDCRATKHRCFRLAVLGIHLHTDSSPLASEMQEAMPNSRSKFIQPLPI